MKEGREELIIKAIADAYDTDEKTRDMLRMALGSVVYRELEIMVAERKAEDARIIEWIAMEESLQG